MAKEQNFIDTSEENVWNVAKPFSYSVIMSTIMQIKEYDNIVKFGSMDFMQEFMMSEEMKKSIKVKALQRLIYAIIQLLRFSKSTIKNKVKKEERGKVEEAEKTLQQLQKAIPSCYRRTKDNKGRGNIVINESKFDGLHSLIMQIYDDVFALVYKAQLIFPVSEEWDPDEMMKKVKEDMIFSG